MEYSTVKVYRFKIALLGVTPSIWREIDVPENYNFWELHVAIQDSMGWLDYHLHEFCPDKKGPTKGKNIGIPESEMDNRLVAGWDISIKKYFTSVGNSIKYFYDFGDEWLHEITLIGITLEKKGVARKLPKCIAGERACPPEDCGGALEFKSLVETLNDKSSEEYPEVVNWLKNHAVNYWPYDPAKFAIKSVKFSDPYLRWCKTFNQPV